VRFPNNIAVCHEYKGQVFVLRTPAIVAWPPVTQTLVFEHFASSGAQLTETTCEANTHAVHAWR